MASYLISSAHKLLWFAGIWSISNSVCAFIDVIPKIIDIDVSNSIIIVKNKSNSPEFVDIALFHVENPGVPPEQEILIPIGLKADPDLYAAPFKLTLGPQQEKKINIRVLNQPMTEQVYRLSIMPQRGFDIKNSNSNVMSVGLGYLVLIRQQPKQKQKSWSYQCVENSIKIIATGTKHVFFSDLKLDTHIIDSFNLYPGTPRIIKGKLLIGLADGKNIQIQC